MLKNIPASISAKLKNISKKLGMPFIYVLRRYAAERLLYRIGISSAADSFVLKGGALFILWNGDIASARPTMDTDFLFVKKLNYDTLLNFFHELCDMEYEEDGIVFSKESVQIQDIRALQAYGGYEVNIFAYIGKIKIPVQIDIGVGDRITPNPDKIEFPGILSELPCAYLKTYPQETVIAEKYETAISKGLTNSRMKDFYDLWTLLHGEIQKSDYLKEAITTTFKQRNTSLPNPKELPICFTKEFASNADKNIQWHAYLKSNNLIAPELDEIVAFISDKFYEITK